MDVDSLKDKWKDLQPAGANDSLTEANLKGIIGRRYNGLFVRMALPKVLIALGYLYWGLFLTVFFHFFPTVLLQTLAIGAIALLVAIPVLNLTAFFRYYRTGRLSLPVGDAMAIVQRRGRSFMQTQYFLFALNLVLMALLVVLVPLVYAEDLGPGTMATAMGIGAALLALVSGWMWRFYRRKIHRINAFAENMR